jgi:hypothetical protein
MISSPGTKTLKTGLTNEFKPRTSFPISPPLYRWAMGGLLGDVQIFWLKEVPCSRIIFCNKYRIIDECIWEKLLKYYHDMLIAICHIWDTTKTNHLEPRTWQNCFSLYYRVFKIYCAFSHKTSGSSPIHQKHMRNSSTQVVASDKWMFSIWT